MSDVDWASLDAMNKAGLSSSQIYDLGGVTVDQILERYPQLAGFIDHPELGVLLRRAAAEGMGPEELQGALHKTEWYQKTWADFRRVEVLKSTDPAEWQAQVEQAGYEIKALMGQLGVDISKNEMLVPLLTENYLRHGKDDWFLFSELGKILIADPSLVAGTGQLAAKVQSLKDFGADMLLDFDDKVYTKHAINTWRKVDTDEGIKERMRQDAIKRYEHLGDGLKRGLTVRELISPLTNTLARTLEMDGEQVDPTDPRWRQIWNYADPQNGKIRMMTMSEVDRFARHQAEFETTKTARDEGYQLSARILESMGQLG